jgi:SAM-dependent methyltransferase
VTRAYVLFPGRHHLLTRFQAEYLGALLAGLAEPRTVVWAVTSANHGNTRRNPVPFDRREAAIERFSVLESQRSLVVPVFDTPPTDRFAEITLKNVENGTPDRLVLTPHNAVVACSTPEVAALYERLGFEIAPVEAGRADAPARPWDVLELLVAGDEAWRRLAHPATIDVYERYGLVAQIRSLHDDPVVGDEGTLTDTRRYRTYVEAFEHSAARKWAQVAPYVRAGRIVDVGCAAGATLELAARDPRLHESDLIGIEVDRVLYEECIHRKAQGAFANPNTFFYQRNILAGPVLPDRSVDTTLTFALTHEVYSYGDGLGSVRELAETIYRHTAPGGVWINADVCGPAGGDRPVVLRFEDADLFARFAQDFRRNAGVAFPYRVRTDGAFVLGLADAMEFLLKKDYVDNWESETHEQFCAVDEPAWRALVSEVGFEVDPASHSWRNDWIVEHRLAPFASLETEDGTPLEWPVTHLLLVARRPVNS